MTLTDVTTRTSNLPANFSDDPYLDYGIEAATAGANFLKFSRNGQGFTYGMDGAPLPLGTRLAANMAGVRVGWLKWVDGKPEKVLSLVTERRKISRDELGDNDPALWEMPGQDPWKQAAELELVDGSGQQYIFSTSSFGGTKGVKKLCYDYARERRSRPGQVPLVELGQHWYPHPKFSKVWEPDFNIIDWVDETTLTPAGQQADGRGGSADPFDLDAPQENTVEAPAEKPVETAAKKPVPVLKAKTPRF
jgi:hypothetical protein